MALIQCAGADVLSGQIHLPLRGAWWARLRLDTPTAPAQKSSATIAAANGLELAGAIAESGAFLDAAWVQVVGGAGGAGVLVPAAAYQNGLVGDPLNAIAAAAGEQLSASISSSVTQIQLPMWTLTNQSAGRLLDELCFLVGQVLGGLVNWRYLSDGTLWIGPESWPNATLPAGADVTWEHPVSPWVEIGCETPALLPGVSLTDIGGAHILSVDHYIEADRIRSSAWI